MDSDTRSRLLQAALELFAAQGYNGASVRDICNVARANPGAVSYHFGGKRQLYRSVLRQAGEQLFSPTGDDTIEGSSTAEQILTTTSRIRRTLVQEPEAVRLVLRDLADGGQAAVEALAPALGRVESWLRAELDRSEHAITKQDVQRSFLELAAPIFLLAAAWPILERSLGLDQATAQRLCDEMVMRALPDSVVD